MNEELFLKLVDDAELDIVFNPDMPDYKWVEGTEEDLMKFAELIVRECAGLFEIEWGDEKLTDNDVGYVVKKHFGVE